uniref:Uncharacterized protein n=1 Tax=Brassica oleracea var. oleracea TaxID=109376 RepID=A0A0D3E3E9_BRAOL
MENRSSQNIGRISITHWQVQEYKRDASNANCTKLMMNLQQALMKVADTNKDADFKLNWKRVAITSMFGLGFVGNVGHFWYGGLDIKALICTEVNTFCGTVAAKVAMDATAYNTDANVSTLQITHSDSMETDSVPPISSPADNSTSISDSLSDMVCVPETTQFNTDSGFIGNITTSTSVSPTSSAPLVFAAAHYHCLPLWWI